MKLDDAVDLVAKRLGNRRGMEDRIRLEMDIVKETLEGGDFLPWFLLSDPQETEITASKITLPPRFLRFHDDVPLWAIKEDRSDRWQLERCGLEVIEPLGTRDEGPPEKIALGRDVMWLVPEPDGTYYLWMVYHRGEPSLDADQGNRWLTHAPDWLVAETIVRMGMQLQMNANFIQAARQEAEMAKQRVMVDSEAREHAMREYIFGGR